MSIRAHKSVAIRAAKAAGSGAPSEEQLAAINRFALRALAADEVYVRTAFLAHNAIDRDREVFDDALLADFARTLPGKGLFVKHPLGWDGDTGPGVGRWFEARVVEMPLDEARAALGEPALQFPSGTAVAKLLETSFYFPRSEKNAGLIADIDAGVAGDVSIGFRAADRTSITDANGTYVASRLHGPGEAMEGSLVWLGAQPGARVHKSAAREREDNDEGKGMDLEKLKKDLEAAEAKAKANEGKAAQFDAMAKAVGEELAANPEQLKRYVEDGKAYFEDLVNEVVNLERLAGYVGDKPEDVKDAKAFYERASVRELKARRDQLAKKFPGGSQLGGGDPNAPAGGEKQKGDGLRDATVTQKALGV